MKEEIKRYLTNLLIVAFLISLCVDGLPTTCRLHGKLQSALAPTLAYSGLWQGGWPLFAPDPDNLNSRLTATLSYADGRTYEWRSPDWSDMNAFKKFFHPREMEYLDNVFQFECEGAWEPFADYLARTHRDPRHPDEHPTKVSLALYWGIIPPPTSESWQPLPDEITYDQKHEFYTRTYTP